MVNVLNNNLYVCLVIKVYFCTKLKSVFVHCKGNYKKGRNIKN